MADPVEPVRMANVEGAVQYGLAAVGVDGRKNIQRVGMVK
jgi:hypothetical protein